MHVAELPLIVFTILTQTAIGLVLISTVRQWAVADGPSNRLHVEWGLALVLLAIGVIASFFHLGHPLGAVRMIVNVGSAWLSREILLIGIFGVLLVVTLAGMYRQMVPSWLPAVTAAVGILAVIAMGMTYAPPSMPAIDNILPVIFFGLTAVVLGTALASYFAPEGKQGLLAGILGAALAVSLVVYLVVPSIWFAGDNVMQATGQLYLGSPFYWTSIIVGMIVPLAVLGWFKRIPVWLPILLLVGEISSRIIFFALVMNSASNLGNLY